MMKLFSLSFSDLSPAPHVSCIEARMLAGHGQHNIEAEIKTEDLSSSHYTVCCNFNKFFKVGDKSMFISLCTRENEIDFQIRL